MQPFGLYIAVAFLVGAASGVATPCLACAVIPALASFRVYTESRPRLQTYRYSDAIRVAAILAAASAIGVMVGSLIMPTLTTAPFFFLTLSGQATWSDTILSVVSQIAGALLYALLASIVVLMITALVTAATLAVLQGRAKSNAVALGPEAPPNDPAA